MQKAKNYDWKDSNLALFGSDLDHQVKKEAAMTETAWRPVGTCKNPQLFVWRIEKFKVVPVDKETYGSFYDGDSYIILNVFKEPESDKLFYDVHFWIGKHSTQDEYGTAAYKTVELDTFLDDRAIQHREVQHHESALFKSYFSSLTYMKGGCDSGFRHVTPEEYKPRLLHFSGNKATKIIVKEVKASRNHLDTGDVFILDAGLQLFQWNGSASSKDERFRAAQYIQELRSSRNGKVSIEVIDEGDHVTDFVEALSDEEVKTKSSKAEQEEKREKALLKLSDASGELDMVPTDFSLSSLDEQDVYIIDGGDALYVYVGEGASYAEKKNALIYAHNYLKSAAAPFSPVTVVDKKNLVGQRNAEFTAVFA